MEHGSAWSPITGTISALSEKLRAVLMSCLSPWCLCFSMRWPTVTSVLPSKATGWFYETEVSLLVIVGTWDQIKHLMGCFTYLNTASSRAKISLYLRELSSHTFGAHDTSYYSAFSTSFGSLSQWLCLLRLKYFLIDFYMTMIFENKNMQQKKLHLYKYIVE